MGSGGSTRLSLGRRAWDAGSCRALGSRRPRELPLPGPLFLRSAEGEPDHGCGHGQQQDEEAQADRRPPAIPPRGSPAVPPPGGVVIADLLVISFVHPPYLPL